MVFMFNVDLVKEVLSQLLKATETIQKRIKTIKCPDDFLNNERSLEKLDALCMQLIAVGESIKNLDKITHRTLLNKYPEFEWKKAMGMRDIISHHYFDLNSEVVFQVCKEEIPKLYKIVKKILTDHSF